MSVYVYCSKVQITPHFNVSEFRCKCGKAHDIVLDDSLPEFLENLFSLLDCSKIIISSGYRCPFHDKAVGGSGNGQHTQGKAADFCCYDKKGAVISSKIVCCAAQLIGFGGIANINSSYTSTHADVRKGILWYGDETKGKKAVTTNFFDYFGIPYDTFSETNNVPRGTFRRGDKGAGVGWIQKKLFEKGYLKKDCISETFDTYTFGAVLAYQKDKGLSVDGVVGEKTIKSIL